MRPTPTPSPSTEGTSHVAGASPARRRRSPRTTAPEAAEQRPRTPAGGSRRTGHGRGARLPPSFSTLWPRRVVVGALCAAASRRWASTGGGRTTSARSSAAARVAAARGCLSCHGVGRPPRRSRRRRGIGSVPRSRTTTWRSTPGHGRDPRVDPGRPAAPAARGARRGAAAAPAHARVARPARREATWTRSSSGLPRCRTSTGARADRGGAPDDRCPGLFRLSRPAGPRRHPEPGLAEGLHPVLERRRFPGAGEGTTASCASG